MNIYLIIDRVVQAALWGSILSANMIPALKLSSNFNLPAVWITERAIDNLSLFLIKEKKNNWMEKYFKDEIVHFLPFGHQRETWTHLV